MKNQKRTPKVFYIDSYAQNAVHEMFNSSMILMCSMIFNNINCRISKSSYQNSLKIIEGRFPENVHYKPLFVFEGNSRFVLILRYLWSAILNVVYVVISPKDSILIFPYNNLFSLRIVNFINKFYNRKILIFCHGEMEGIRSDAKRGGLLHKILIWLSKNFFLNSKIKISKRIYFSVLGEVLKENISKLISDDKIEKFITIDHPYIFKENEVIKKEELKLNIATIGAISKTKGLLELLDFVSKIDKKLRNNINISVIGSTHEDIRLFEPYEIELASKDNSLLSREEFTRRLNNLDYILFFYGKNNYNVTASGAIMDAINYKKPILALKNDYFEYIFRKYGSFGYLFDTIDEMVSKTEEFAVNNLKNDFNFIDIENKFTPEFLSLHLKRELITIGFLRS